MLLAFMHAAAYDTARGRYDSSLSKCIAPSYSASESGVVKRDCNILSAVSDASSPSATIFCGASVLAVSLSVVVKITEHSLECGRKSAKPVASAVGEPPCWTVVLSTLSKISKHCCVLSFAMQRLTICSMSA